MGFFDRLKKGLSKSRGNLTERVDELVENTAVVDDDFYEELKKNGIPVEYFVVKDAPHMGMEFYQKEMADRILGFLNRNL